MMKRLKELIILLHRYIAIPLSVIVVAWFVSGIVMMYTRGMPALSVEQSLELRSAIPLFEISVSPGDALQRNGFSAEPGEIAIDALLFRPAYRFGADSEVTVFADNGELFAGADEHAGREIVATAFGLPVSRIRFAGELSDPDQWTITEGRHLPMLKFELDDQYETEAYVSILTGEIVLATDRTSRFLAWIGAIPHWIYFTSLRTSQPAWFWTIVILSTLGCLITLLGLVLTFTQFRKSTPFRIDNSIRYRGLMKWHYLTGAIFGLFALTWLFSGLLSMDPFRWNQESGLYIDDVELNGGPVRVEVLDVGTITALPAGPSLKRLEAINLLGEPRFIAWHSGGAGRRIINPDSPHEVAPAGVIAELVASLEDISGEMVSDAELLTDYDSYYYDREHIRPLPVLRVTFGDPDRTSAYIDTATGRIVGRTHRFARLDRWLFNGLHSLDFGFWYDKRPLWDIVVITLSLGGLMTSGIGMVLGIRRMRRAVSRRGPGN